MATPSKMPLRAGDLIRMNRKGSSSSDHRSRIVKMSRRCISGSRCRKYCSSPFGLQIVRGLRRTVRATRLTIVQSVHLTIRVARQKIKLPSLLWASTIVMYAAKLFAPRPHLQRTCYVKMVVEYIFSEVLDMRW
jgi:hypothetical protein